MPASNSDARKRHEDSELTMRWEAAKKMETTIVGLSGWAQSGKDSMASVLVEQGYERLAFADPLRALARAINPFVYVYEDHDPTASFGVDDYEYASDIYLEFDKGVDAYEWLKANTTYRAFLQDLGTGVRDVLGESTWVDAAMSKVQDGGKYVFTDVRFPNEFAAVQHAGGKVWRIERAGHQPPNDHISERALDDFKFDRVLTFQDCGDDLDALYAAMRALA